MQQQIDQHVANLNGTDLDFEASRDSIHQSNNNNRASAFGNHDLSGIRITKRDHDLVNIKLKYED